MPLATDKPRKVQPPSNPEGCGPLVSRLQTAVRAGQRLMPHQIAWREKFYKAQIGNLVSDPEKQLAGLLADGTGQVLLLKCDFEQGWPQQGHTIHIQGKRYYVESDDQVTGGAAISLTVTLKR